MSENILALERKQEKNSSSVQTTKKKKNKQEEEAAEYRQKTKRIVVTESNYNALMARGRFGQTFNDVVAELLNPADMPIKRSRYGSDNPNSKRQGQLLEVTR